MIVSSSGSIPRYPKLLKFNLSLISFSSDSINQTVVIPLVLHCIISQYLEPYFETNENKKRLRFSSKLLLDYTMAQPPRHQTLSKITVQ